MIHLRPYLYQHWLKYTYYTDLITTDITTYRFSDLDAFWWIKCYATVMDAQYSTYIAGYYGYGSIG